MSERARTSTDIHFETWGDRSKPAILLGPHFYPSLFRSEGPGSNMCAWIDGLRADFFLVAADYPRGIGETGGETGRSSGDLPDTARAGHAQVAVRDYERIADAAGVERFGWLGYSFGGAMGVQVAYRSDRVAALAVGGFPPLNAPFRQLLAMSLRAAEAPPMLPAFVHAAALGAAVGFYESLIDWPEGECVTRLSMPKLVFMGDNDTAQGAAESVSLAENLRLVEPQVRALGWQVEWLRGHDHVSALNAAVALPSVRDFFMTALRRT